jgi:beta-N-acetylhexosaminidase
MKDAASAVIVAAVEGLTLTAAELDFFVKETPAGVTLFRRNIPQDDYPQVKSLNQALQKTRPPSDPPLVIAVDQEGGRVSRFPKTFPDMGPALKLFDGGTSQDSLHKISDYGDTVGRTLLNLGFNVNFAPVADVLTEPTNNSIGDRVFGVNPEQATPRAQAYLDGLQKSGVLGCLKHFPGQGDARVDTHYAGAPIDISLQTLWSRELAPFRSMMPSVDMVMISHSIYPVISEKEASRSHVVIEDWLRGRLGFSGVVVSDDLNMGALPQDIENWQDALVECVAAGCDMLLVCRHLERCYAALEALRRESAKSTAFRSRLELAATRVTSMRQRLKS